MSTIADKLQVKKARTLAVVGAKPALDKMIGAARAPAAKADVVLLFVAHRAALEKTLPPLLARIRADAILWLAYPKLTSKLAGDLNRDSIRAWVPSIGLDTVSQIAIDDNWSALRLKRT